MYKQGQIVLIPFPFTNQSGSKPRPALVVSGSVLNKTADILLVQITSNQRADSFSIPIDNSKDVTKPLKYISEIRCNKLLVAEQSLIIKPPSPISEVKPDVIKQVIAKINTIFQP